MIQAEETSLASKMLSLALALASVFAFGIHSFFNLRGHTEFKTLIWLPILFAMSGASVSQLVTTILWLR